MNDVKVTALLEKLLVPLEKVNTEVSGKQDHPEASNTNETK